MNTHLQGVLVPSLLNLGGRRLFVSLILRDGRLPQSNPLPTTRMTTPREKTSYSFNILTEFRSRDPPLVLITHLII